MNSSGRQRIEYAQLREALETILIQHRQNPSRIKSLRRRISEYSSSYTIENLVVEMDDGARSNLVLKNLSPGSILQTAKAIRPGFLYLPRREIETYSKILQPRQLGPPLCYGTFERNEEALFWLFLERVRGPLLWQLGTLDPWKDAARWLARLHTSFPTGPELEAHADMQHLLKFGPDFLKIWPARAEKFVSQRNLGDSPESRARFTRLLDHYDRVVARLLDFPAAFIHGEFYPSNIIVQATATERRICPVDWEMASIGPALIDVATLTSGAWSESQRRVMIEAYQQGLDIAGATRQDLSDLMEGVDYCQLHLAVQMLGWSADWAPPERHAQNWFREAIRLAERLSI